MKNTNQGRHALGVLNEDALLRELNALRRICRAVPNIKALCKNLKESDPEAAEALKQALKGTQ